MRKLGGGCSRLNFLPVERFRHILQRENQILIIVARDFRNLFQNEFVQKCRKQLYVFVRRDVVARFQNTLRRARTDFVDEIENARERDAIVEILDKAQLRDEIADVRLLEELNPARDNEGNGKIGEFELELFRLKMRPVKHDNIGKRVAFVFDERADFRNDGVRLRKGVQLRNNVGQGSVFPRGAQLFGETGFLRACAQN